MHLDTKDGHSNIGKGEKKVFLGEKKVNSIEMVES
jgi:hypothetical protein